MVVVVGMEGSNDAESCAGCGIATGGVYHAKEVKGDDRDAKGYPGPPGWRFGVRMASPDKIYVC